MIALSIMFVARVFDRRGCKVLKHPRLTIPQGVADTLLFKGVTCNEEIQFRSVWTYLV